MSRLLRTAAGAALGAAMSEIAQRGGEVLVGDLVFSVVMVGAAAAHALAKPPRDARIYTDREGGRVTVRQAKILRPEFEWLRDPPGLETFDAGKVPVSNVRVMDVRDRDPRNWSFVHRGWSEIDSATRPGEIASRAVREMVLDTYLRGANIGDMQADRVIRFTPKAGECEYDRALKLDAANNLLWFASVVRRGIFDPADMRQKQAA